MEYHGSHADRPAAFSQCEWRRRRIPTQHCMESVMHLVHAGTERSDNEGETTQRERHMRYYTDIRAIALYNLFINIG